MNDEMKIVKEMEYAKNLMDDKRGVEVLAYGIIKNHPFLVTNMHGLHPCAYLALAGKDYPNARENLPVHCGVTWVGSDLPIWFAKIAEKEEIDKYCLKTDHAFWVGWDYAHAGDFFPPFDELRGALFDDKKWTVQEIIGEIKEAVEWLDGKAHEQRQNH